jgi:hypothetical protein
MGISNERETKMEKRFWIGFDGFDSLKLHFETRRDAEQHLADNRKDLFHHCEHHVAVYENKSEETKETH